MDPARKTSPQEVKWNLAPDSHIANCVEPAAGAGEDSNGCKGDERQARREGGAASTANRRQVPRLRASPVRVWLGVNVHPPCPIVKTLRGITASCHPEERRVSANLKAVCGNPDSSLALRMTRGLDCSLSGDCRRAPSQLEDETAGLGDEIDEHRHGQEEGEEEVQVQLLPPRAEARVDIGRIVRQP